MGYDCNLPGIWSKDIPCPILSRYVAFASFVPGSHMAVSLKIGVFPPKWMVKISENPIKMDDLGGKTPYFLETPIYVILIIMGKILIP